MATRSPGGETCVRQNSGSLRSSDTPANAGNILTPSMVRSLGRGMPAISSTVANMSVPITGTSLTVPGWMCPGQRATPGTRMPPSWSLRLLPRRPPEDPPKLGTGPLSDVKKWSLNAHPNCPPQVPLEVITQALRYGELRALDRSIDRTMTIVTMASMKRCMPEIVVASANLQCSTTPGCCGYKVFYPIRQARH